MITIFKIFEKVNQGKPEIGDYVICYPLDKPYFPDIAQYNEFIVSHIGKIVDLHCGYKMKDRFDNRGKLEGVMEYEIAEIPERLKNEYFVAWRGSSEMCYTTVSDISEFQYWSKNRTDLEAILTQKRFDL